MRCFKILKPEIIQILLLLFRYQHLQKRILLQLLQLLQPQLSLAISTTCAAQPLQGHARSRRGRRRSRCFLLPCRLHRPQRCRNRRTRKQTSRTLYRSGLPHRAGSGCRPPTTWHPGQHRLGADVSLPLLASALGWTGIGRS